MPKTVKRGVLEFFREHRMKVGHVIPEKSFRFGFLQNLNPKEQEQVPAALQELMDEGVVEERPSARHGDIPLFLTQLGFDLIYADNFFPENSSPKETQMAGHTFNFNGPSNIQIGDHNSQQIQNYFHELEKMIEGSNASVEEKEKSKSLLMRVSENPLLASLITGVGSLAIKNVLGIP
jgi:hypothetical protein